MNRARQFAARSSAIFCGCALLLFAVAAHASDHRGAFSEEFHQTYALEADGSVELDNINGAVHISAWDQNEVKVDAVKYADSKGDSIKRGLKSIRARTIFRFVPSIRTTI